MHTSWESLEKKIGLTRLPPYFRRLWKEDEGASERELLLPLLAERDIANYPDWFGFSRELTGHIRRVSALIDRDRDLKAAAVFLHWALYIARPFYFVPWFPGLAADKLGQDAALFGLCVLCREAPRTVLDLERRNHPNPKDVLDNFKQVNDYAKAFFKQEGHWGLGNAAWCALCVTPFLNTAHHLRFAPAVLGYAYTLYRHKKTQALLCLAGGGMGLRQDGLVPADGQSPALETVYEKWGDRVLAHRVRASGFVSPRPERFDLGEYEALIASGDTLLGFHIPSGPGYDIPTCIKSFDAALKLFGTTYPEVRHKGFYCDSWLFSPQLALLMTPEESRIVAIQRQMFMLPIHSDREAFATFLYNLDKMPEPAELPGGSRLQALVREHLMQGRHLTVGGAVLPLIDLPRFGQTPYFREEDLALFRELQG